MYLVHFTHKILALVSQFAFFEPLITALHRNRIFRVSRYKSA